MILLITTSTRTFLHWIPHIYILRLIFTLTIHPWLTSGWSGCLFWKSSCCSRLYSTVFPHRRAGLVVVVTVLECVRFPLVSGDVLWLGRPHKADLAGFPKSTRSTVTSCSPRHWNWSLLLLYWILSQSIYGIIYALKGMGVQCSIIVWEATGADHCTTTLPLYKTLKSVWYY